MPTAKQTAANRMNSQKSTGPRTPEGKAASRFNALKHGIFATTQIMFDESAEDLAELAAEYHEHHNPADPEQRFLVDTLVSNEWRLRRLRRVEAELWQGASNVFLEKNAESPACSSGDAFAAAAHLRAPPTSRQCLRAHLSPRPQTTKSGAGAFPRQPRSPTARSRSRLRPATRTIHTHFRENGFVWAKSANARSSSPSTPRRAPAGRPTW
jgi:hypothetical protein